MSGHGIDLMGDTESKWKRLNKKTLLVEDKETINCHNLSKGQLDHIHQSIKCAHSLTQHSLF
jgi:hypothetical protein